MKTSLHLYLESLEVCNHFSDPVIHDLSELELLGPDGFPDLGFLAGSASLILVSDHVAHSLEILILLLYLVQVIFQIDCVVGLVRRRQSKQAVAAQLLVAIQTIEVVLVVVDMTLCLSDSRSPSSCRWREWLLLILSIQQLLN